MGLFKVFSQNPKDGDPLSMKGIAEGLVRMAHAWETLSIEGGSIEWNNGEPKINVEGGSYSGGDGGGDAVMDYPGRVYLEDGNIKVTSVPCNFWTGDSWNSTSKSEDGTNAWGELTGEYIYIRLDVSSASPVWTLSHESMPTFPDSSTPLSSDSQTQRSWILAQVDSGGTITQHWMGAIYETMGG